MRHNRLRQNKNEFMLNMNKNGLKRLKLRELHLKSRLQKLRHRLLRLLEKHKRMRMRCLFLLMRKLKD